MRRMKSLWQTPIGYYVTDTGAGPDHDIGGPFKSYEEARRFAQTHLKKTPLGIYRVYRWLRSMRRDLQHTIYPEPGATVHATKKSRSQLDLEIAESLSGGSGQVEPKALYTAKQRAAQAEIKLSAIPSGAWSRARVVAVLREVDTEALREIERLHIMGAGIFTAGRQVAKWAREVLDERGSSSHAKRRKIGAPSGPLSVYDTLLRDAMIDALARHHQSIRLAAQDLRMPTSTFVDKARAWGVVLERHDDHGRSYHATRRGADPHADRGDRVLADLKRWGIDREQIDEVRAAFRAGDHRRAMALAKDLGWNRAAKRGRGGSYHATRRQVEVDTSVYRRYHGAEPRGFGDWTFVIGKREYERSDDPALYRPAYARGAQKAGRAGLPFAKAKEYAIAEAKRRGTTIIGVGP